MGVPLLHLTEGWTAEIGPFTISRRVTVDNLDTDTPVDLTDLAVLPYWTPNGALMGVPGTGTVRVAADQSADRGQFYYTPAAGELQSESSPYALRVELTDQAGRVAYWPNGKPSEVLVYAR